MSGVLENIRVFLMTVEAGSLSEAGRILRLSSAVVSYRIRTLEDHLGCRLLVRTTRQMNLTEAGRIFYERCTEVTEALDRAEASVADHGGSPRTAIKFTAPLGLGRKVIAPLIPQFRRNNPTTELRLRLSDHLLDIVKESVDVALRIANLRDSSLTHRKIADARRVICASPHYIERHGAPVVPEDLLKHPCLLLRFPGSLQFRWALGHGRTTNTVPVSGPIDADDGDVLTDWAVAGLGLVMKPLFEVARELADGRLRIVLENYPPQSAQVALLYPSKKLQSRSVRNLLDLMHEETRQHIKGELAFVNQ